MTMPRTAATIAPETLHPSLWLASQLAHSTTRCIDTGYAAFGATARRRLADRHVDRLAATAAGHRRIAAAASGAGQPGIAPHRAAGAAAPAASGGGGLVGTAAVAAGVGAQRRQKRRRAVGGRTNPAQRLLRRAAVLAAARARRHAAPAASGRAKRRYLVLHAQAAHQRAGFVAGAATAVVAPGRRRHRYRLHQTKGTATRHTIIFATGYPCTTAHRAFG